MRAKIQFLSTSFLLIFLGLIFSINLAFGACTDPLKPVAVPSVIGKAQADAVSAILGAGLGVGTVTTQVTSASPAGTIISQSPTASLPSDDPAPDTCVSATTQVNLIVAINPLITVPNVIGKPQQEATLTINNTCLPTNPTLCLKAGTLTQAASSTIPKGNVISQDPAAGFQTPAGSAVNLVISSGPALLAVPDVVGKTQLDAEALIKSTCVTGTTQCLRVGTVTQATSETVAAGSVISQDPPSGFQAAINTAVNLVVSSGKAPVTVPNVVGQALASAQTALEGAGFKLGTISQASSETVAAGVVIGQNPSGGSQAAPGSLINVTISSGPAKPSTPTVTPGDIEVPDVVGLSKTAATAAIRNVGLLVGATISKFDDSVPAGNVLDQSPAAGSKVAAGTAVSLTVSLGPAGVVKVPDVTGLSAEAARSVLQTAGLTVGNTLTQPDPSTPSGNVIKTDPVAGTQVEAGSAVDLIVSTGLSQAQQCTVPDVVNQTVDDARQILFATCLSEIGSTTVRSDPEIPAGKVAAQVPTAGTSIGYNTTVNLVVSSGSQPPVVAPRVVGLTLADATVVINNVGLTVGFVSRQTSNTVEEGRVISQNPLMTASVPVGWPVNLVVSLGPIPEDPAARPQTLVPDLTGLTLAAATTKLIEANLQVGLVSNQRSAEVPAGQVIRQSPASDSTVAISSKVNLVMSFGPYAYGLFSGPAYITNYAGGTVSILNPETNQVVDNIPVGISGSGPSGIAVHPDGTKLYIANRPRFGQSAGTVSVIDLIERKVATTISVGVAPLGIALNPTGERLFVANEGSFSLSVINTSTNQPFIDLNVPNLSANSYPRGIAAHPNPLRPLVYVTNRTVNSFSDDETNPYVDQCDALVARPPVNVNPDQCVGSLSIFDADLKTQVGSVAVGSAPEGVAVHPDGSLVYVANSGDRTVSIMETVFNRVIGVITLDEFGGAPQPLVPRGVTVSPDGNRLYVTDGAGNRLFVIDTTANHAVVDIIPVGKKPYGVAVSPDSKRVYVANTDDNTVSVVDSQSHAIIATIPTGLGPWAFGQFVGPLATVATPTLDPSSGAFPGNVTVKISTTTAGASIRYTTDGTTPTSTVGTLIGNGESVALAANTANVKIILKAIAFKDTWADSEVVEGTYMLNSWLFGGDNADP
ncbi:MAG TPA: PASTA domain-containing protein [Candidatus Competibacter sp.]|nr:PASTA domain-containing protein [Candidatus Competibacter sp.]